jgi:L-iditol 2-dehydrogenase
MKKMKAVRLYGKEDLRVEEIPVPEIGAGEILIKTGASLICGTDVRMYKNGAAKTPVVLGHELAGSIAAVGVGITAYTEGQRVAVAPNYGCGNCDHCIAGNTHLCADLKAIGIHVDGGFAEYVRIPAPAVTQGNISPIGASVSFAEAAMAEPLSCVYNSYERSGVKPGDTVLIIGAGPIGLMHAKIYKMAGAGQVIINDVNEERLAGCKAEDASFVTLGPERTKERLLELTAGRGADVVVTAASVAAVQQAAFEYAALNARVIFFGGLPAGKEIVPLDTNVIHYKMITVTGTSRQNLRQYRTCLDLIRQNLVSVRNIVTGEYSLDDAATAFDAAARGQGLKSGFVLN